MTLEELGSRLLAAEKRLQQVEDIEQVKQIHNRYVNALTFVKWDDVIDCFAEDCSIDVGFGGFPKGKANVGKFFKEMLFQIHIGKEGIFSVHPLITVEGDTAKGNWLMYIMYADHRTWASRYWLQGIYDCEFVRENGEWKFSYLQWRPRLEPPGAVPPELAP